MLTLNSHFLAAVLCLFLAVGMLLKMLRIKSVHLPRIERVSIFEVITLLKLARMFCLNKPFRYDQAYCF